MRDVSHVDVRVEEQPIGSITIKSEDDGNRASALYCMTSRIQSRASRFYGR